MYFKEQIREISQNICHEEDCGDCISCPYKLYDNCIDVKTADKIYAMGYRKQTHRGEWRIAKRPTGKMECTCSNCLATYTGDGIENFVADFNFCPHCGAKMKGE